MTTTTTSPTHAPANVAAWFELPVRDMARAVGFYEQVLELRLRREQIAGGELAVFPYAEPATSGCLIAKAGLEPSGQGAIVYLSVDGRLDRIMERVIQAGGRLASPRIELPPGMGAFVHAIDSEGNRVGFHDAA